MIYRSISDFGIKRISRYLKKSQDILDREDVLDILSGQYNNTEVSRDQLEHWIASSEYQLMEVHVILPDLGITFGKSGESFSEGPIIVDLNINQVARSFEGIGGAPPDFLVLDGQNRVISARKLGLRETLWAYVGDSALSLLQDKENEILQLFNEVDSAIEDFLSTPSSPGGYLSKLKSYVSQGLLSEEELQGIRSEWKSRYSVS